MYVLFVKKLLKLLTISCLSALFRNLFEIGVIYNIISNKRCLLLRDVIVGFLREEIDLVNVYVLRMGKIYIWDCRHKDNKPAITHFKQLNMTQKSMLEKKNRISIYFSLKKWNLYENSFLNP